MPINRYRWERAITSRTGLYRYIPPLPEGMSLALSDVLNVEMPYQQFGPDTHYRLAENFSRNSQFETLTVGAQGKGIIFVVGESDRKFNIMTEDIEQTTLCQGIVWKNTFYVQVDYPGRGNGAAAFKWAEFLQIAMTDRQQRYLSLTTRYQEHTEGTLLRTIAGAGYQPYEINIQGVTTWRYLP